ncbi:MAG TPA: SpoIIE family protein phosphatase [Thermoanaerobaculia bacterium]|nr:SpoIIE family protein phosphatase [Thermoanaerobaculia bacterium]
MQLRKSTKGWLLALAVETVLAVALSSSKGALGCLGAICAALAASSALVLAVRAIVALFRLITRGIALRLAFSYFLIGVVPIPLLAALLFAVAYLLCVQLVGTETRRELRAVVEEAAVGTNRPAEFRVRNGVVASSRFDWLHPGDAVPWVRDLSQPRALTAGEGVWYAVRPDPADPDRIALVSFAEPRSALLQQLADRSGYEVRVGLGENRRRRVDGIDFQVSKKQEREWKEAVRPRNVPPATGSTLMTTEWVVGVYVEKPVVRIAPESSEQVVVLVARTSPQVLFDQLFSQGVPEVGKVFWGIFAGLAAALLLVYLAALAIAFFLVANIARSVNRLTRATEAVSRGDFSVRVQSKARDQIGDLARSFDGMAASIERLLLQTAEKERLDAEIAVARTIQQKLLPPSEAELRGMSLVARFEPVAEIGGDYYDYFAMPDGRTAVTIGDVSGHGLPTGLLVAMAKAALATQIESGLTGSALFARLNDLIHRSTDTRNYMTLALLAYDPATRRAELTNAGQLAPYRLSGSAVTSLSLPSFPLGLFSTREYPTISFEVAAGDRLLFLTDGLVEAVDASGEPFGFERLEALLREEVSSDAGRLRDAVLAAVQAHAAGIPLEDDRTIVVLTIT